MIEVPDDLVRSLEGIATAQHMSIEQLLVERLHSLVQDRPEPRPGSPAAILQAMRELPHPSAEAVDELDAAIAAGRLPVRTPDLFSD